MVKEKVKFICQDCGYESPKWMGKCPGCENWNTLIEEMVPKVFSSPNFSTSFINGGLPQSIINIETLEETRSLTSIQEVDRVLGGGIVAGSLVLIGGDPGIGKSTLLLQVSNLYSQRYGKVLYVSGEESARQIKLRAERLGTLSDDLYILPETNIEEIERQIGTLQPRLVVIDSIQMVYNPNLSSIPGSVGQVRECTANLMKIAKGKGIPVFIVGHITKEGTLAGPRVLEHMVDTVLYFEGEKHYAYRILRAVKNRFGSTNEIGIFQMGEAGLEEIPNPSEALLAERTIGVPGSVVISNLEGTRPLLVEVQALVSSSNLASPRRTATGLDYQRVALLLAVLEKRLGMFLSTQDVYVNVVGGIKLSEPAADLGVTVAIASSFKDLTVSPNYVLIGEVGLTGEVRGVSQIEARISEAAKLGFKKCIIPGNSLRNLGKSTKLEVIGVKNVEKALELVLGGE